MIELKGQKAIDRIALLTIGWDPAERTEIFNKILAAHAQAELELCPHMTLAQRERSNREFGQAMMRRLNQIFGSVAYQGGHAGHA